MASKVFLDANILLDLTLKRDNFEQARRIIRLAVDGDIQAFMTPSVVHIVGHWLSKAYGNAKAKEILLTLLADITVIDLPHEIAVNALHSRITDIEDALQYYTAIHHKSDYFISRDRQLQKQGIPALAVYTPEEFLEEFER
ncbi:type II toxin-antitoxin system VapC family toxin [Sediminibacterium soli]|uniref:type II toxin-antitoxin system VapC family toxin n=1 Tax=Sediminibacterium soli TaxID=2698829 RepID=UPI0013795F62|nr:PIN domain-containing protein [Sediminibacterium soli]NCI47427.1 PIN domain-containing protein [Sediminibacterium soli]